jgi:hypothetical protein
MDISRVWNKWKHSLILTKRFGNLKTEHARMTKLVIEKINFIILDELILSFSHYQSLIIMRKITVILSLILDQKSISLSHLVPKITDNLIEVKNEKIPSFLMFLSTKDYKTDILTNQ